MANENDIGGKVGLDVTDFKAGIAELNRQIKVIDSGFKAAAAGMDNWGQSEEGLQQRISSLNQITDLQRQKIAALNEQYKKVAAEKGENSKAAQDLQVRINKETEALNKNVLELNRSKNALDNFGKEAIDTAKDTEKLDQSVEEASAGLREMGGKVAKAAAIGIAAIGAAALAAIGGVLKFGNDSSKAMNKLQAQTGASAAEMEEFREIATDIYKAKLGESIDDVARSMATVKQVTQQTGAELENTTKRALLLRDTFEFDVSESVGTVNSLMKKFGISAEQAYTLIAQGAQQGANKNGDMLEVLNEYAPQFAALGFSAEQFTDILIQGAKDGSFSIDKTGDAIKEFTIRSKDMSKNTTEAFSTLGLDADKMGAAFAAGGSQAQRAFGAVLTAMNELDDPLIRNQVGVQLFGTQFEDLEASAILSLGNVQSYTNQTADTLHQINDIQYNDISSALEGIKRNLVTSIVEPIGQMLLPKILEMSQSIKNIDVTPIVNGLSWIIDNAGTLASVAIAIGAGMATWNVISIVQNLIKVIQAWRLATEGMSIAQAALNLVMSKNPIGLIITVIAALVAGIITLWNTNEDFRNTLIAAWEAIRKAGVAVWSWLVKFFTKDIPAAFNTVLDFMKNNWKEILLFITNPIAGALALLYKLNPQFKEWVDGIFAAIVNTLRNAPGEMLEIGKNIVQGLWKGISSLGDWVKDKVEGFVSGIGKTIKSFFGIASPSKLTTEYGEFIAEGLAVGIDKKADKAESAAKKAATAAAKAMKESFDDALQDADYRFKMGELDVSGYVSALETVRSEYAKTADQVRKVNLQIYEAEKQAAKDSQKTYQQIHDDRVKELDRLGGAITTALKNRYAKEEQTVTSSLQKQMDAHKEASELIIKGYDAEYDAKLKTLDIDTQFQLRTLQGQIDRINGQTTAEEKAIDEQAYLKRLADKKKELADATSADARAKIQDEMNQMIADRERKALLEQRQRQIDSIREEMESVRTQAQEKQTLLQQELADKKSKEDEKAKAVQTSLTSQMDATKKHYANLTTEEALQAEARLFAVDENNQELINLLETYNADWQNAGQSFGQALLDGLNSTKENIKSAVSDILSAVQRVNVSNEAAYLNEYLKTGTAGQREWALGQAKNYGLDVINGVIQDMRSNVDSLSSNVQGRQSAAATAGAASSSTTNTFSFEGMFTGASFAVRNNDDITQIANRVAQVIENKATTRRRSGGSR